LAPIEARLVEVLLARCGSVVSRRELGAAAWPAGVPGERAVDARLRRLRTRVEPLGLSIHSVRRRGLLLEVAEPPAVGELSA
jgi:DNA-binding response OmpR family regulator